VGFHTGYTLQRLLPRLSTSLVDRIIIDPQGWQDFSRRLEQGWL